MTILYAEDDSMTVMEVQEKLENNGYEVIVAYDGNEALEKFIACKPDLIVLDVDMPEKTDSRSCSLYGFRIVKHLSLFIVA